MERGAGAHMTRDPLNQGLQERRHMTDPARHDRAVDLHPAAPVNVCLAMQREMIAISIRTADEVYVRLHGPKRWYRHDYSDEELADWATKIRDSGAKRAWVYFNNDFDAYAPKNAVGLRGMLRRAQSFR